MQHDLWTYRDQTIGDVDLTGYDVEATDGSIGKVDEATFEVGDSYIVIDTGPWIFGKTVLLPAGTIDRIDSASERIFVNLTKEQIKSSPEYDEQIGVSDEYRTGVATYYGEPSLTGRGRDAI